jgi:hypothetical protein
MSNSLITTSPEIMGGHSCVRWYSCAGANSFRYLEAGDASRDFIGHEVRLIETSPSNRMSRALAWQLWLSGRRRTV